MYLIKRTFQIFIVTCFALPVSAYADSWSCSKSNDVREVHIERSTSAPVPCHVLYKKQTEGVEDQILWNANNDATYCEEKAQGLIAKLESVGWVCTETIRDKAMKNTMNEAETAPDDAEEAATEKAKTSLDGANETVTDDAKTVPDEATDETIN